MNSVIVTTPTPTVSPFIQNLEQQKQKPQTSKEAIAANVQALIQQLEEGHSEGLTAYLTAMGRFPCQGRSKSEPVWRSKREPLGV